jgi:hypothetical protein
MAQQLKTPKLANKSRMPLLFAFHDLHFKLIIREIETYSILQSRQSLQLLADVSPFQQRSAGFQEHFNPAVSF